MAFRSLLPLALFLQCVSPSSSAIDSSMCIAIWTFRLPCTEPVGNLVNQLKTWSTKKCKDGPENCMYEILNETQDQLEVKHTSPETGKITDIKFFYGPIASKFFCKIKAMSTTTATNGTLPSDYCLLYNLIDASGLAQAEGYKEICNKEMCPSMASLPCNMDEDFYI